MPAPLARYGERGNMVIRQWRLLVMLRRGSQTVNALARELGCTPRTVRRDLDILQCVPFPISVLKDLGDKEHRYFLKDSRHWPRNEYAPVREREATA